MAPNPNTPRPALDCFICSKTIATWEPFGTWAVLTPDGTAATVAHHASCFLKTIASEVSAAVADMQNTGEVERLSAEGVSDGNIRTIFRQLARQTLEELLSRG